MPSAWMSSKNELERFNFILPTKALGSAMLVAACVQG